MSFVSFFAGHRLAVVTALAFVGATLAGCGGDGSYAQAAPVSVPPAPTANYAIGGTTSGLKGSGLVLQNNAGDDLPIASDGTFRFATPMSDGLTYLASVKTAPTSRHVSSPRNGMAQRVPPEWRASSSQREPLTHMI